MELSPRVTGVVASGYARAVYVANRVAVELLLSLRQPWAGALAGEAVGPDDYLLAFEAARFVDRPAVLVDAWVAIPDFTCCDVSVAIEVTADGRSWTGPSFDHFWHQGGWFLAVADVLEGATSSTTFVWDQSSLNVRREGDRLMPAGRSSARRSRGIR
jgi:hypothetical protein